MAQRPKTNKKNIPKNIHEMSPETLKETLEKKRECNAKALKIVGILCEPCVDEEWLLANLQFINQCHFSDVIVERAITKLCGYPLCNQKLDKVLPQQYRISTRYNKVFDISERKNFCSSCCYKSAMFVKKQLFTSPLWFRDQEIIPKYTVLKTIKSSLGEEVVLIPSKIKLESDDAKNKNISSNKTVILDKNINELEKKCSNLEIEDNEKLVPGKSGTKNSMENMSNCDIQKEVKKTNNGGIKEEPLKNVIDITSKKVEITKTKMKIKEEPIDIIKKVEKCIFEWFSLDTFFYLYGEEKLKELFKDKASIIKEILNSKLSLAGHNDKINRMIQLYGLLDTDSFSSSEIKTNLKPLPDYSIIKEEGKVLEIKVRAFYQGQLQVKKPENEGEEEKESSPETEPIYLPLVDAHAQIALRKKIVLDKLNKVLPELMKVFNSDFVLQGNEIRNLVSTFALSPHNITFKPAVWYLVGLILIKLLSLKDKKLESILNLESSTQQMFIILLNYELQKDYLDNLVHRLTGSVSLMEKLNEIKRSTLQGAGFSGQVSQKYTVSGLPPFFARFRVISATESQPAPRPLKSLKLK